MKRTGTLSILLLALLLPSCATMREIGRTAAASALASAPRVVDFPALRQAGLYLPPKRISIVNGVTEMPAYCEIVVYDKHLGVLASGDIAVNRDVFEPFSWVQIPILAKCYRNAGLTDYIGVAHTVLYSGQYSYQQAAVSWTFGCRDIRAPGRKNACPTTNEFPQTNLRRRAVEFDRFFLEGTSLAQIVNNRESDTAVVTIGELRLTIPPQGGVAFLMSYTLSQYASTHAQANVLYVRDGALVDRSSFAFSAATRGVWGQQVILQ